MNYILQQRIYLLQEVERLARTLNITGDVSYTCETANYFFLYHIVSRWEEYLQLCHKVLTGNDNDSICCHRVEQEFPFRSYFGEALKFDSYPTAKGKLDYARACFRDIQHIFRRLQEFMAFEQMRSGAERSKYLLLKEAKIIAMTCTHAALKRKDLVSLGFKYDNIIMEEAAQILEIETFIPLLLQNPDIGHLRLKRWIMIGDHNQLAPVVKNIAFQKYSNMEQSLFTRMIRLGVPVVRLDAQGRSRRSIAALYQWRYPGLGNLPHIDELDKYANAGFVYDYQLIDSDWLDCSGTGESEPVPHFFQNLVEAECAVSLYMFMRLIGYPSNRITILTTYNGQKHMIREVIKRRCYPFDGSFEFGFPSKVTTVDKYQGQQNDYIILSLVRTKSVGHLRDVRRLIVAMSRAKLGLYIIGRTALFKTCIDLNPVFNMLIKRPLRLQLVPDERYSTESKELSLSRRPCDSVETHRVFEPRNLIDLLEFTYNMLEKKNSEKTSDKIVTEAPETLS